MELKNEEEAMELVKGFIEEYLHGNIDKLKNFSFWDIEGIDKYDGNPKGKFDGDRTEIVYAIDYLLYKDKGIPNFTLDSLGNIYTGDTINTFNTLFGSESMRALVEEKFLFSADEKNKINDFFYNYQAIGNFYILPADKPETGITINQLRGTNSWKDYFDIFLKKLDECFLGRSTDTNIEPLKELMNIRINKDFFDIFSTKKKFCELFYLEDYLTLEYNHPSDYVCGHHRFSEKKISKEQYKQFAFSYIQKATELINKRSEKLVEVLKEKYPELKIKRKIN